MIMMIIVIIMISMNTINITNITYIIILIIFIFIVFIREIFIESIFFQNCTRNSAHNNPYINGFMIKLVVYILEINIIKFLFENESIFFSVKRNNKKNNGKLSTTYDIDTTKSVIVI
jgi:hypothetical protein